SDTPAAQPARCPLSLHDALPISATGSLRISGRGSWLDAGRPVRADSTLSLREDSGVVSYVPGDLTLTVRAGTTLAEISDITSERSEEHTSELQSPYDLVCRLLLE